MCRACSEGGRRCSDSWSPQLKAIKATEAEARRRLNRRKRRVVAGVVGDRFDKHARAAVMECSPNRLILIADRMDELVPGSAAEISEKLGGSELPGTHNMVVQDLRSETARTDLDIYGELKTDPLSTVRALPALNAVDRAALDAGVVPPGEEAALRAELDIRERAVVTGVQPSGPMDWEQADFYEFSDLAEVTALGRVSSRFEDRLRQQMLKTVEVDAASRVSLLGEGEKYLTPSELAKTDPGAVSKGGLPVSEGVTLRRDDEGNLYYHVDGKYRLPATDMELVGRKVEKIPYVDEDSLIFDSDKAPAGQKALYQRLAQDPQTRDALVEGVIRSSFTHESLAGRGTVLLDDVFTEVALPGRNPRNSPAQLVGVGSRRPGAMSGASSVCQVANAHLARAAGVQKATADQVAARAGVIGGIREQRAKAAARVGDVAAGSFRHVGADPDPATERALVRASRAASDDPGSRSRRNKEPRHSSLFMSMGTGFTDHDVDEAVIRANRVRITEGTRDNENTKDLESFYRVSGSVHKAEVSRAIGKQSAAAPGSPVTMSSFSHIDSDTDVGAVFGVGSSVAPSGFVSAGVRVPRPRKGKGTRVVRSVYTTSRGVQVSPTRTILGPDDLFRVVRVDENKDGSLVVHLADEDSLLEKEVG